MGGVPVHQQFPREGVPSPEAFLTGCVWARLVCLQGTGNSPPYIGQRLSTLEFSARPFLPSLSLSLSLSIPSAGSQSYGKDANTSGPFLPSFPPASTEYPGSTGTEGQGKSQMNRILALAEKGSCWYGVGSTALASLLPLGIKRWVLKYV